MASKQPTAIQRKKVADSSPQPTLPAWKAFVVQFSSETEPRSGAFSGRVEHLSSGRRVHFHSSAELVAILRRLLYELGKPES
jgi:hypothetical protein